MQFTLKNILCGMMRRKKITCGKVGLALGSGSSKGWAHIGVIKALEDAGIKIDYVAGTSIGALVGAVYASGNIKELEEVVLQFDWKRVASLFDLILPRSGLIDGKKISAFVRGQVDARNIEDLELPFCAVATDLVSGSEVLLDKGDIIEAVRASVSIPGMFTPVKCDGTFLVDGGLVNPVPVSVLREMGADFVIAVDLNYDTPESRTAMMEESERHREVKEEAEEPHEQTKKHRIWEALNKRLSSMEVRAFSQVRSWIGTRSLPGIFEVMSTSINIMEAQITAKNFEVYPPDLLIQPDLGDFRLLDYNRGEEAIEKGYKAAREALKEVL